MRKNLLIVLSVMILLIIIVGLTTYNLTKSWSDLSDIVTKNVAKAILMEEVSFLIDREVKKSELYTIKPNPEIKTEINITNETILDRIKLIKYISNNSEKYQLEIIKQYYTKNIYLNSINIVNKVDSGLTKKNGSKKPSISVMIMVNEIFEHNNKVLNKIYSLKTYSLFTYEKSISHLKDYSRYVTLTITYICVFLGIILMSISFNYIGRLYDRIEKQAKILEINLNNIKEINKELIISNDLNINIQEAERLRIAQDLHDEIIQNLIGLSRKTDLNYSDFNVKEIHEELKQTIIHIRKICQNLRPSILNDLGLNSAIEWLLDDLEKYGIVPSLSITGKVKENIPEKIQLTIFRVVQELLNNVKKHSQASNVSLVINYNNNEINITLVDDGCGFYYNPNITTQSLGLIGIKERIKTISGKIDINSEISKGTTVNIHIPLNNSSIIIN